jgi:DNA mismatch repair endonuclease MutH
MTKMLLEDALEMILALEGRTLGSISTPDIINKGSVGQIIERAIGVDLSSDLLDFQNGELKSNKFLQGAPAETLAVTQIGHVLKEIQGEISWARSSVLKKIQSFIFLPVHKDASDPEDWVVGHAIHFSEKQFPRQYKKLGNDYEEIGTEIRKILNGNGSLHTTNGKNNYLQIRTKDSKDKSGAYHPVKFNGRALSNKNYAFYLRPHFLNAVLNQNP